jgi:hypothetical protein
VLRISHVKTIQAGTIQARPIQVDLVFIICCQTGIFLPLTGKPNNFYLDGQEWVEKASIADAVIRGTKPSFPNLQVQGFQF